MLESLTAGRDTRVLSRSELVAMVAALMAINALSIDIMLPALPDIGKSFAVAHVNDRQLVIVSYVMASGFAQLVHGPLADALGRRRVLLGALGVFLVGALLCIVASDFHLFLAARVVQGLSAAAIRVVATALVRDLVAGPRMAQIMSTAMTIFMIVPILAPSVGQMILLVGPWRWIFALLLVAGVTIFVWSYFRVPETLPPERRQPLSFASAFSSYAKVVRTRATMGYTIGLMLTFGALFSFLTSSQQIFGEVYRLGPLFPIAFASIAVTLSAAQFSNSRLVMRVGMRRLAHIAVTGFAAMCVLHAVHAQFFAENLTLFLCLLLPTMYLFGFMGANFNAIAMEPMGEIAGAASAFTGFVSTVGGSFLGGLIGRAFDGSIGPMLTGQAILAILAVVVIFVTERGKFFPRLSPGDPLR